MQAVAQRVISSGVCVDGKTVGTIGAGLNILLCVVQGDGKKQAELLAAKLAKLRIFQDAQGKMNRSLLDCGGEVLVIPQFTLCADMKKGNRPSFFEAAEPEEARGLFVYFCEQLSCAGVRKVQRGVFGADMRVSICNQGPVTILLDTKNLG